MSRKLNEQEELVFKAKTGLTRVPGWAWNKVLAPEDIEDFPFYKQSKEPATIMDVDLNLLIGTTHDSYNKSPWVDMVISLHRSFVDSLAKANEDLETRLMSNCGQGMRGTVTVISSMGTETIEQV